MDTFVRRTPRSNGHQELGSAFRYSLYLTLYKTETSLRRHFVSVQLVSVLESVQWLYSGHLYKTDNSVRETL